MLNNKIKEAKILIIDDQEANVAVLESLLAREGYTRVMGITDSRKSLQTFEEYQPDLILLDLLMPHLDGFAVMEQLRTAIPSDTYLPILVLTADISPEARQRALSSGAKDFLTKPIDLIEVRLRIQNLLETRFLHVQIQNRSQILNELVLERTSELTHANEELSRANAQLLAEMAVREQAEAALTAREEHFRALIDNAPDGIVLVAEDGKIKYVSPSTQRIMGYIPEDIVDREPGELTHPEDLPKVLALLNDMMQQPGQVMTSQYRFRHKDGSWRWVESTISNLLAEKSVEALVFNYRDITNRKAAEARISHEAARAESLLSIASRLNAQLNLETALSTVCEAAAQALNTPAANVYLFNTLEHTFDYASGFGFPSNYKNMVKPIPHDLYDRLISDPAKPSLLDVELIPEVYDLIPVEALNIRSLAGVSLMRGDQLIGSLSVYTFGEERAFTGDELSLLQGLADQAAQAIANARLYEDAQRRLLNMQALHRIDTTINNTLSLKLLLQVVLEELTSHLNVDAASVLLAKAHINTLEYVAGHGFETDNIRKTRVLFGEDLPGRVALERQPVHIHNHVEQHFNEKRFNLLAPEKIQAYYGVPLIAKGQIQGVLEIFHRSPLEPDSEWLDFVETIAGQAAIAIENTTLFTNLQRSNTELALAYDITLEGWSRAMDLRDRETEGHTERVAEMTIKLAEALGLSELEIVNARRGALLHDMGKLGIPDEILHKPGKLNEDEWEIMKKHPVLAYELLAPIDYLRPALDIPYCHHEKWDGTGYPRGLKGKEIPIAARIFTIADVWDALRSDRPYRKAWPDDKVISYIREHSGDYFEPKVVETFLKIIEEL
ncbi:MAG TPA: HD domain-containing phosphohydrolase [Anaerolineales bacterium]|nr:HD domain-containing phosphohydrolase [Anaerolineales bacterium]